MGKAEEAKGVVAVETEIKLRIEDPAAIRARLLDLGFEELRPRTFEDNRLLDTPAGAFAARGQLLRLRSLGARSTLTFKGPARGDPRFKNREELEVEVSDAAALGEIFARLGLAPAYRYQKYRAELVRDGLHACVDETPIGAYLELEGAPAAIEAAAAELGFGPADYLVVSYRDLHLQQARERGESEPGDLVFGDGSSAGR